MRATPQLVLCVEAVPDGTSTPDPAAARRATEAFITPVVARHGGICHGVLEGRIVAAFPDEAAGRRCAEEVLSAAGPADGLILRIGIAQDPEGGALPGSRAVATAARRCAAARPGAANDASGEAGHLGHAAAAIVPLGGAGLGLMRWWSRPQSPPGDAVSAADSEVATLATTLPEPLPPEPLPPELSPRVTEEPEPVEAPDLRYDDVLLFFTSPEQEAIAVDSLERFAAAGLDLPEGLEIHFHDDSEACGGHARAIAVHGLETERIEMCTSHDFTLRHELGHIWVWEHLEDADRDAFIEERELPTWSDVAFPWDQRGTEHAAHIIAWGLGDVPIRLSEISVYDFDYLTEGFQLLTGRLPLHHSEDGLPEQDEPAWSDVAEDLTPGRESADLVFEPDGLSLDPQLDAPAPDPFALGDEWVPLTDDDELGDDGEEPI